MELFNMMQNIRGINVEEEIKKAILKVRNELTCLTENQTCLIYSSYLFEDLKYRGINVRLINTMDLGLNFEHYFVLVKSADNYFLGDLTYSQFLDSNFNNLLIDGYMKLDNNILNEYLSLIDRKEITDFSCDYLFYMDINDIKR